MARRLVLVDQALFLRYSNHLDRGLHRLEDRNALAECKAEAVFLRCD